MGSSSRYSSSPPRRRRTTPRSAGAVVKAKESAKDLERVDAEIDPVTPVPTVPRVSSSTSPSSAVRGTASTIVAASAIRDPPITVIDDNQRDCATKRPIHDMDEQKSKTTNRSATGSGGDKAKHRSTSNDMKVSNENKNNTINEITNNSNADNQSCENHLPADDNDENRKGPEILSAITALVTTVEPPQSLDHSLSSLVPLPSKPTPVLDVMVHRIRGLHFHPKAVCCMAATNVVVAMESSSKTKDSTSFNAAHRRRWFADSWIAISRDNGMIELKSANQKFRTLTVVPGLRSRPLHVLTWTRCHNDNNSSNNRSSIPTLVGATHDGLLCIVDVIGTGRWMALTPSLGGTILSLATAPAPHNNVVAAGYQDGAIRLYRVVVAVDDNGNGDHQLELLATLPSTAGSPITALAWQPLSTSVSSNDELNNHGILRSSSVGGACMSGSVLLAGVADGTIRRYEATMRADGDTNNNWSNWKCVMRMTVENLGRVAPTRIWALLCLRDGTIVSGDSLGHVQLWHGQTGTVLQTFQQSSAKADVLALAVNDDETTIFASGVDSRVVCIERPRAGRDSSSSPSWIMTHAQRPHTHDVKAMCICRVKMHKSHHHHHIRKGSGADYPETAEILCTAGLDTKLCTYSIANFSKRRPKWVYPWPAVSPVQSAATARLVTMLREDRIDMYALATLPSSTLTPNNNKNMMSTPMVVRDTSSLNDNTLIGTVQVQSNSNLVCSAMSADGKYLAVSDASTLLLFQLRFHQSPTKNHDHDFALTLAMERPTKIAIANAITRSSLAGVVAAHFLRNDLLVVAQSNQRLSVIAIDAHYGDDDNDDDNSSSEAKTVDTFLLGTKEQVSNDSFPLFPIHAIVSFGDGEWFAVVRHGIVSGLIEVFRRSQGMSDQYQRWWTLPALEAPASATAFVPNAEQNATRPLLAVACINYAVYVFDVQHRQLGSWNESIGFPMSKALPAALQQRPDYPIRMTCDPGNPSKLLVGSFGAFVIFDTSSHSSLGSGCRVFPETHVRGTKRRKRSLSLSEENALGKDDSGNNNNNNGIDDDQGGVTSRGPSRAVTKTIGCTMCLRYNSMLHLDYIGDREMIIVEEPWLNVVSTFPDALQRNVYGN